MNDDEEKGNQKDLKEILSKKFSYATAADIKKISRSVYVTDANTGEIKSIFPDAILSFERIQVSDQDSITRLLLEGAANAQQADQLDVLESVDEILSQINGTPSQAHIAALEDILIKERQADARGQLDRFLKASQSNLGAMNARLFTFLRRMDQRIDTSQQEISAWEKGKNIHVLQRRSQSPFWRGFYRLTGQTILNELNRHTDRKKELEKIRGDRQRGESVRRDQISEKERLDLQERHRLEKMVSDPQMSEDDRGRLKGHLQAMSFQSKLRSFRFIRQTEAERERYVREKAPEMVMDRGHCRTPEWDGEGPKRTR